jgi:hypothetical protein
LINSAAYRYATPDNLNATENSAPAGEKTIRAFAATWPARAVIPRLDQRELSLLSGNAFIDPLLVFDR